MILCPNRRNRRLIQGFTLVEVMMASAIGLMVLIGLFAIVLQTGKEQMRGLSDNALEQQAGLTQDKLTELLRVMSGTESVIFGDAVEGGWQRIVISQGKSPDHAREEILFDPITRTLMHDPDRATPGNEVPLHRPKNSVVIRDLYFFPSIKGDGTLDASMINVWMEFDDSGTDQTASSGTRRTNAVARSFTVKMRNS